MGMSPPMIARACATISDSGVELAFSHHGAVQCQQQAIDGLCRASRVVNSPRELAIGFGCDQARGHGSRVHGRQQLPAKFTRAIEHAADAAA